MYRTVEGPTYMTERLNEESAPIGVVAVLNGFHVQLCTLVTQARQSGAPDWALAHLLGIAAGVVAAIAGELDDVIERGIENGRKHHSDALAKATVEGGIS